MGFESMPARTEAFVRSFFRLPFAIRFSEFLPIQESGSRVQGPGSRVQGSGFRVQGSGFRVLAEAFLRFLLRLSLSRPCLQDSGCGV